MLLAEPPSRLLFERCLESGPPVFCCQRESCFLAALHAERRAAASRKGVGIDPTETLLQKMQQVVPH